MLFHFDNMPIGLSKMLAFFVGVHQAASFPASLPSTPAA
jgi:hypothetical protein